MPRVAASIDGGRAMPRGRSRRPNRFQHLLVALAALGLMIGVRPASFSRGRLALAPAAPAPIVDLAAIDAAPDPVPTRAEADAGPSVSSREEAGPGEDADEAIDPAWPDLGVISRPGRPRWQASLPITFPPGPARQSRPAFHRPGPAPDSPPLDLPIRLCRLTC